MEYLFYFFTFALGAILGSFLNVVIYRHNTGLTFMGRSFCFSCNKQLTWKELFPIASFLVLRGKCSSCKSIIAKQYTLVEVSMGILSSLIFWRLGGMQEFLNKAFSERIDLEWVLLIAVLFAVFGLLLIICVYDFKHKIIPDFWVYSFTVVSLVRMIFMPGTFAFPLSVWDLLAGPILALPFALLWYFSDGRWMGFGDAKLALGIGWFLGLHAGVTAIVLAFWIGALFGLVLLALGKIKESFFSRSKITLKSELPFAPFLILGIFLVFFIPSIMDFVPLAVF